MKIAHTYYQLFIRTVLGAVGAWLVLSSFTSFTLLGSYNTQADMVVADNFSNVYTLSKNRLLKFGPDGKYQFPYEEFRYGKMGMLDVTNPLKLLVYFPDFQTVVTLDRFLSPLTNYNFTERGYVNITAIASSVDGRMWFYDNVDFKLKKTDESGRIFRESQPLNVITGSAPNPNFMVEKERQVYVNDPQQGIYVFDFFGSYIKTIPLKGLQRFQVFQNQIVYFDGKQLKTYNPMTFEWKELNLPDSTDVVHAAIEKERLAVLKKDKVLIYQYR